MQAIISFIATVIIEGLDLLAFHRDCIRDLFVATVLIGGVAFLISLAANRRPDLPRRRPPLEGPFYSRDLGLGPAEDLIFPLQTPVTLLPCGSRAEGSED